MKTARTLGSPQAVDRGGHPVWGVGTGEGASPLPAEAFWDDLVIKICFITPRQGFPPCITTRCPSGAG